MSTIIHLAITEEEANKVLDARMEKSFGGKENLDRFLAGVEEDAAKAAEHQAAHRKK